MSNEDTGLLDESFKDGGGIPFIALEGEGDDAKFRVTDEAVEFLKTLRGPIALASIVGRYRTGKSLLVNRMLLDVQGGGFQVGATVNSCTKGLWLWNKPLKVKNKNGQEVSLLIIDSEGIGSLDADADHDAKIFALALLLSSYFIYNSVGSIDESALNSLSLVVELTKHIRTKADTEGSEPETGAEFSQFFPHFLWVVRDFSLILEDESGSSFTSKTYLERSLTPMAGFSEGVEVKNRIRRMLLAFFPNRDCVTLKRPVEDETQLQNLDNADWSAFRPEFVAQVHGLRKKIYQDAPPKCLHGKPLDGFMLGHLAINYAEAINNGTALNIGDAWSQVSKSRNVKAVEEAHEHYERNAAACVDEMPMTVEHLDERHLAMRQEALADFKKTCIGVGQEVEEYLHSLDERIRDEYKDLQKQNSKIGREKCEAAIAKAYEKLSAKVEAKGYASLKEYESERAEAKSEYMQEIPDNPERLLVMSTFFEKEIPAAGGKIAAHLSLLAETALAEKQEALRVAAADLKDLKMRSEAEAEDLTTRLKHAEGALEETAERERELKTRTEEEKARLQKQLEDETGALRDELAATTSKLEGELQQATDKAKASAAEAQSSLAEAEKKAMLAEGERQHTQQQVDSLKKDKDAASADGEKLRAKVKELEKDITSLRAQGDEAGEAKRGVERKLEEALEAADELKKDAQSKAAESESTAGSFSAERQEAAAEKARLDERVKSLEESVRTKEASLAEEKASREKLGKDKEAQEQMLRGSETTLRSDNESLRVRANEAEASVKTMETQMKAKEEALNDKEKASARASEDASKVSGDTVKAAGEATKAAENALEQAKGEAAAAAKKADEEIAALKLDAAQSKAETGDAGKAAGEATKVLEKALEQAKGEQAAAAKKADEEIAALKLEAAQSKERASAAEVKAASAPKDGSTNEQLVNVLERQGKMQDEFNKESEALTSRFKQIEAENENLHLVVMKMKTHVEKAEDEGYRGGEDVRSIMGTLKSIGSQGLAKAGVNGSNGAPRQDGKGEQWVMLDKSKQQAARPKNEIVFKPVQQDVFAQVAKQSGRTTEDVYKAHEAGKASQGVSASTVGSGEKFSFARLRQAISKKVSGAITKVDEWADNVEGVLLGGQGVGTPPRPADGGFYHANSPTPPAGVDAKDRDQAREVVSNLQWKSPDQNKMAAGRSKIENFRAKSAGGATPQKGLEFSGPEDPT